MAAAELDADALTLEITETALMRDPEAAGEWLAELKAQGIRIAIFPVDLLKIDRSFALRSRHRLSLTSWSAPVEAPSRPRRGPPERARQAEPDC